MYFLSFLLSVSHFFFIFSHPPLPSNNFVYIRLAWMKRFLVWFTSSFTVYIVGYTQIQNIAANEKKIVKKIASTFPYYVKVKEEKVVPKYQTETNFTRNKFVHIFQIHIIKIFDCCVLLFCLPSWLNLFVYLFFSLHSHSLQQIVSYFELNYKK